MHARTLSRSTYLLCALTQAAAAAACAALGPGPAPSCLLAFTSVPEPLIRPVLRALSEASSAPFAGCNSVQLSCSRAPAGTFHVTVAAARMPSVRVHAFQSVEVREAASSSSPYHPLPHPLSQPPFSLPSCCHLPLLLLLPLLIVFVSQDSLPAIPHLSAALSSPPQFLVLSAQEAFLQVRDRLEVRPGTKGEKGSAQAREAPEGHEGAAVMQAHSLAHPACLPPSPLAARTCLAQGRALRPPRPAFRCPTAAPPRSCPAAA